MLKKTEQNLDIIFEAGEDLYNSNKSQIVLIKGSIIKIPITSNR